MRAKEGYKHICINTNSFECIKYYIAISLMYHISNSQKCIQKPRKSNIVYRPTSCWYIRLLSTCCAPVRQHNNTAACWLPPAAITINGFNAATQHALISVFCAFPAHTVHSV